MTQYKNYGFDAFGDCAGIKRTEIDNIPASSPAYITFDNVKNKYLGYKGEYNIITTFESLVLPKYLKSSHWNSLTKEHKNFCYGCTLIEGMRHNNPSPNSPVKWKTISISHYIKSIDELL